MFFSSWFDIFLYLMRNTTKVNHPMEKLLKRYEIPLIKKNQEVTAKIISISKKGVLFDIGGKSPAVLGNLEVSQLATYLPYLKIGDRIKVKIISEESRMGFPVVSLQKFFEKGKWEILEEKKEKEEEIEVVCGEYGKGGVFVDFMGIRGVIPKIQLIEPYFSQPEKLEGERIKVKILEVNREKNRLVVSQKAAALKISQKELKKKFDKVVVGKIYQAKVISVSEFGIFCEVDGVEGLVHISEISWEKVSDPRAFVKPGQTISVMVVEKNPNDLKLNLSLKRLLPDPWEKLEEKYSKDQEIEAEVVRLEKYGVFVRLEPGVEGLIHISKLTGEENIEVGQKVKVFIEKVNKKNRRMSLILAKKAKPVMYR